MLIFWIILYGAISLFSFGCTVLFFAKEDYGAAIMFLIIGLLMAIFTYSAIQGRRQEQGKTIKESKTANKIFSIFFFLWWFLLGLSGIFGGISFFIFGKTTYEYLYGAFGVFLGWAFLSTARGMWKQMRQKSEEPTKAKKDAGITTSKIASKINKKIILLVAGIIILVVLAVAFFSSSTFSKKKGVVLQEFDFPVWSLRQGDVTVFRQDEYFTDSSDRNIVVGNTSANTEEDIYIYDVIPSSLADNVRDLSFKTLTPEIIQPENPIVLRFKIDEISAQKSKVISISSKKSYSALQSMCTAAKTYDCKTYTQQIVNAAEEKTRTQYQPNAEKVYGAYRGNEPNIPVNTKQFIEQVKQNSKIAIISAEPSVTEGTISGQFEKVYAFFTDLVEKIKEIKGIETKEKSLPPKSTALSENFFAKNFTQVWVLSKVEDMPTDTSICRAIIPKKTMNGKYEIPQAYQKGITASKKTSQIVQISVFDSIENRDKALKGCTGRDARIASGYRVEIQLRDQMGFNVKRYMASQDNYLIVIPGTSGLVLSYISPAWDEFFFSKTVLPEIRKQIKLNYE